MRRKLGYAEKWADVMRSVGHALDELVRHRSTYSTKINKLIGDNFTEFKREGSSASVQKFD